MPSTESTTFRYPLVESSLGPEEREAMLQVIDSDRLTLGSRVEEFERACAARLGSRWAVMVNSGSSANLVGTAALCLRDPDPLRPGDEVVVPCIAWATTYYPFLQYGLRLRFADVDLETLTYDVGSLRAAVSDRTRMVVAVNILGNPCDFAPIVELCRERGLILFEDNCEAFGARYAGRPTGTFGLIGTCSTYFSHQLNTIEGGLLLTDDPGIYHLARALRNHGWDRDLDSASPLSGAGPDFPEAYHFVLPGYNLRPTELQAAVGLLQLGKLDGFLAARRRNRELFLERFGGDERFILQRENGESSWFSFTMIVRPGRGPSRSRVFEALRAAGIDFRMVTGGNFLRHRVIRFFDHTVAGSGNADLVHDHGFFVGNFHRDLTGELDLLHRTLAAI